MPNFSPLLPLNLLPDKCVGRLRRLSGRTIYKACNDRSKSIFIHVPRTAGTSISFALFGEDVGHYSAEMYNSVDPSKFDRYFTFGFVRDPIDRFVSAYNYLRNGGGTLADKKFSERHMSKFPNMIDVLQKLYQEKETFGFLKIMSWGHFVPQAHFLCDRSGKVLVDFTGQVENIGKDFQFVSRKIYDEDIQLPRLNSSEYLRNHSLGKYEKRLIFHVYREDYGIFNYKRPV